MNTFINRRVAILYSWLMAIIMSHSESNLSSYYSNLSSIQTSIVATIVTSRTYYRSTVGQSTVTLEACLVPSSTHI